MYYVAHAVLLCRPRGTDPYSVDEMLQRAQKAASSAEALLGLLDDLLEAAEEPVAEPADAEFILKNTRNCHGFYGASSMERLPTEVALTEQTRRFKRITGK